MCKYPAVEECGEKWESWRAQHQIKRHLPFPIHQLITIPHTCIDLIDWQRGVMALFVSLLLDLFSGLYKFIYIYATEQEGLC
jgi:hypothetical protein